MKEEEEEEAVFIRGVNTNEDPPNAHQAQHRPVEEEETVFKEGKTAASSRHKWLKTIQRGTEW